MTRVLAFLVRNWPLKLAAIVLSTLLYAGLVLSQNARELTVSIPIRPIGQQPNTHLVTDLGNVTRISYLTTDDTFRPSTSTFEAWVDLRAVEPSSRPTPVPVVVESTDARVTITGVVPTTVLVQLDPLVSKRVPVEPQWGDVPENLDIRDPTVSPAEVTVSGPQSIIDRVAVARADVIVEPSGLDVDREVQLVPVDAVGEPLSPVDVEPRTARVRIAVFSDLQSRSLTVSPAVTGTPAAGYEIAGVSVEPTVVTVEGDADEISALTHVTTEPINVEGATETVDTMVALALPENVLPLGGERVRVTVELRQVTGTRSFNVGVRLVGARGDRTYALSSDRVVLTLGGPVATLAAIDGRTLTARADVAGLGPGSGDVRLTADLPSGVTLDSVSPSSITVTVGLPEPTPTPAAPSPAPAASPAASPS